ncbi:serine hydrolase domain-containing protein [Chloroflexota bacterium]
MALDGSRNELKYTMMHMSMLHRILPLVHGDRKRPWLLIIPLLVAVLSISLISCGPEYTYQVPEATGDGLHTASLESVELDGQTLGELIRLIKQGKYKNIHSILIIKDEELVFEEYFNGYVFDPSDDQLRGEHIEFGINTIHNLASVTKSITSALIGIAIDHGFIKSVEQDIFTFFPEYSHLNNSEKNKITLEHLLTMTSGLEWHELELPYTEENDLIQLFIVPGPIEYILAKPVIAEAGTRWYYSGGDVNLLGEIIKNATGLRIDDFAEKYLFKPLGISEYEWVYLNPDIVYTSGDLKLRPRDMAKLGYLYLKNGIWNGKRVISEEWVKASTEEYISVPIPHFTEMYGESYGYHWWLRTDYDDLEPYQSFLRTGWGGQRISVYPEVNMVVILTGGNYVTNEPVNEITSRFILPALR